MVSRVNGTTNVVARRVAITSIAAALFAATATQNVLPLTKQRTYEVMQVAEIEEVPSTIGMADSELYLQGSLDQINDRLDLMQSLGVTNVRILVPWAGVQPLHPDTPFGLGAPRWDQLDMVVNAAAERGMGILGVINSTPVWATTRTPINGQPTSFSRYADFAKSVALRYGDKISAYEVWNEPNSAQFWNPLDPVAYTEMLKVTYTALKEASVQTGSDITVVGGVVGAGLTWGNATMNPVDFVRRMYDAGADGYFDALSFHPYNYDSKFSVGESLPWREGMPLYQVNRIRELMDSYQDVGEEQVKIWITEYGVPTNKVSEATQAAFVRDLIEFWQTAEGAGPIFVYTTQDRLDPAGTDDEAHLGIFRADGSMKPAAEVVRELIAELSDPTNPGPDPDPGPGPVTPPVNPIAALLQALQQAVTSVFNLVPNLLNAVGVAITNLISGIFGGASRPTTRTVRSATAGLDEDIAADGESSVLQVETAEDATTAGSTVEAAEDAGTADADMAPEVAAAVSERGLTEEVTKPGVEEGPVETETAEPTTEVTPAEAVEGATEVTTEPTVPATEQTEPVTESTTAPEATEAADVEEPDAKSADTVDGADTKVPDEDAPASAKRSDAATVESGKADIAEAVEDDAASETRETDAPSSTPRDEQDSGGSADEAEAETETGQGSASSSRTPVGATAEGGSE